MANNFLVLGTLAALGWVFVSGPPPSTQPTARPAASPVAAIAKSPALEQRRDPVPLVRNIRVSAAPPAPAGPAAPAEAPAVAAEQQAQDDLDRRAAKAAAELDGYKRVTILGKASNGAWRAKGYRGATEVRLTVDGTGRVSMD